MNEILETIIGNEFVALSSVSRSDFITIAFVRVNLSEYACRNSLILLLFSQVYIPELTRNIFRRVGTLSSIHGTELMDEQRVPRIMRRSDC